MTKASVKKLDTIQEEEHVRHVKRSMGQNKHRAQSITIGKSGACSTEISLRGVDGSYLFSIYHPAEVIELIHQLAANIGCHIHVQPRSDFSSYREWREVEEAEQEHLNGWAPFPMTTEGLPRIGFGRLSPDRPFKLQNDIQNLKKQLAEQQQLLEATKTQSKEQDNVVATKKTVNKRSTKRSRSSTK